MTETRKEIDRMDAELRRVYNEYREKHPEEARKLDRNNQQAWERAAHYVQERLRAEKG